MEENKDKNWVQKNWLWAIPTGCIGLVTCCFLVILGFFAFFVSIIQNSDIYQQSMSTLRENERAKILLGEPVESGWLIVGNIETNFDNGVESGFADLKIPVSGPDGSGKMVIVATNRDGRWNYDQFELQMDDGFETVDLRHR